MVNENQIKKGLCLFLERNILPTFDASSPERAIIATLAGLSLANWDGIKKIQNNPVSQLFGVFDQSGNIDIEKLGEEFKKNIPETGLRFDIEFNMLFKKISKVLWIQKEDVDTLLNYIMNA
jgi:hypothetical protein